MVLYHRKAEPVRCQLRIAVEIVPDGCDKQCQEKHQNAYDAQIASGNRWQIIVLCLLYEVKKAGRDVYKRQTEYRISDSRFPNTIKMAENIRHAVIIL